MTIIFIRVQNTDWRWTYRVLIIWTFVQWIMLLTVSAFQTQPIHY